MTLGIKSLYEGPSLKPFDGHPTKEPTAIMVEERAGRVDLTIGEGCCSFEPAEAMRLGNAIIDAATLALRHVSAVRK